MKNDFRRLLIKYLASKGIVENFNAPTLSLYHILADLEGLQKKVTKKGTASILLRKWVTDNIVRNKNPILGLTEKQKKKGLLKNNDNFFTSWEWTELRFKVLKHYGFKCMCCGISPKEGAIMHVDHIKPRSKFPSLALDFANLQVLCASCNKGKGAWDQTDFRESQDLPEEQLSHIKDIVRH